MHEENEEEGRTASDAGRRGCLLVCIGTVLGWIFVGMVVTCAVTRPARAQTVCCGPSGYAWTCAAGDSKCRNPILGIECAGTGYSIVQASACVAATPTPTPMPTLTPTPTATPTPVLPITLTRLPYLPWPFSYQYQVPWIQQQPDGSVVISCNSGHYPNESLTPPALGSSSTWPGECKVVVLFPANGSTPQARQTYCTSQTTDTWETGNFIVPVQTNPAQLHTYGVFTGRPVGPLGGDSDRDVQLEMVTFATTQGIPTVLSPNFYRYTVLAGKSSNYSLMGIVDLAGHQMAYVGALYKIGSWPYLLMRFRITQSGQFEADPAFPPVKMSTVADGIQGPLNLVLANDGKTLLTTDGPWPVTTACHLWQSADQGQTWSATGIAIPAPTGSVGIAQCGIAVKPGGEAFAPMWGVCQTFWSQDGDDGMDWSKAGDWRPYIWYQQGANLPSNLFTAAVAYPPAAQTMTINPVPNPKPAAAKAVSVKTAAPTWLPGAILRPRPTPGTP